VSRALRLDLPSLAASRRQLIDAELIAYQKPLYQVLGLVDPTPAVAATPAGGQSTRSIGDILRQALGGVA